MRSTLILLIALTAACGARYKRTRNGPLFQHLPKFHNGPPDHTKYRLWRTSGSYRTDTSEPKIMAESGEVYQIVHQPISPEKVVPTHILPKDDGISDLSLTIQNRPENTFPAHILPKDDIMSDVTLTIPNKPDDSFPVHSGYIIPEDDVVPSGPNVLPKDADISDLPLNVPIAPDDSFSVHPIYQLPTGDDIRDIKLKTQRPRPPYEIYDDDRIRQFKDQLNRPYVSQPFLTNYDIDDSIFPLSPQDPNRPSNSFPPHDFGHAIPLQYHPNIIAINKDFYLYSAPPFALPIFGFYILSIIRPEKRLAYLEGKLRPFMDPGSLIPRYEHLALQGPSIILDLNALPPLYYSSKISESNLVDDDTDDEPIWNNDYYNFNDINKKLLNNGKGFNDDKAWDSGIVVNYVKK